MTFNIIDHLDKLDPDGGSESPNEKSFLCPVCGSDNFKVELKTGKYSTFGCDCADNEDGKRKIRNALSPAKNPKGKSESLKPIRAAHPGKCWDYYLPDGTKAITVHRTDDGKGKRTFSQQSHVAGKLPRDLKSQVLPYGFEIAWQAVIDGELVHWVEGESCVDAMQARGLAAVTSLGGCKQFDPSRDGNHFKPEQLVVWPDQDDLGIDYAEKVASAYPGCKWGFAYPGSQHWNGKRPSDGGLDVADYIANGATVEDLHGCIGSKDKEPIAKPKGVATGDLEDMGWTALLDEILNSIRHEKTDREMKARAEIKYRYRISDEQLNTALFKRHGEGKVKKVKPVHDSVSIADVEALDYQLDGWIQKGDVGLLYGAYGTGKTTLAIWKALHLAKGINILDRNTPCEPGKSLIIATDSGLGPLKKSFLDLGLDPDTDPLFMPGHPDQMIYIWGYDPKQGHAAWICDIAGVIKLEQFIVNKGIGYVAIDSAKSVSSAAGWSYTSNESVKALLKHLREAVAAPTGACIEFLSHDGTEKGSHSGAKALAEDPSMVASLVLQKDESTGKESVQCQFKKDRAAVVDPRRKLTYFLDDCQLVLAPEVEVVSTCDDAIIEVLWTAHQNEVIHVKTKELKDEVFARFRKSAKTVENTLPRLNKKRIVSPRRGCWKLAPAEIQLRESKPSPYRDPSYTGGLIKKPL